MKLTTYVSDLQDEFVSQTSVIKCVECDEEIGEKIDDTDPSKIKCSQCIHTPGIFQEMGADPEDKLDLFRRGFDTIESY
jgi:DNA-directed RNA polymerase subunit RPC12/RpoP